MNQKNANIAALVIDRNIKPKQTQLPIIKLLLIAVTLLFLCLYFFNSKNIIAQTNNAQQELKSTSSIVQVRKTIKPKKKLLNVAPVISSLKKVLDASGHIVALRIATVSSRVTGKITQLNIEEGQKVTKNEVLAEIDDEKAKISYQLALADLAANKANLDEIKSKLAYQKKRLSRNKKLLQQKLISQQSTDNSAARMAQIKAQLMNKIAFVELANQRLDLAKYQLNHHKIRAPFSGVVISKNAQVGELISTRSSAGGSIRTGVATIVDMNSLEIEVEVGESYINRVFAGQSTIATLDAYPNWKIKSEVAVIIPTADRQKASIKVRIKLLSNDLRIFPDMGVKVSFLKS